MNRSPEFIMSTDAECLTALAGTSDMERTAEAARAFVSTIGRLAPSLPGPSGIFNGYGRVYVDTGQHVEFAACECDSPYALPVVLAQQQQLARRAVRQMEEVSGNRLILANNNHDGLLTDSTSSVWGAHENYLVAEHPKNFSARILPFLATRIYAGAGAIRYPTAELVAGVRAQAMQYDIGGATTNERALHSLARDEHHMGPNPSRFRYHLIAADGHRSHFNIALQFGATALALKAILFDPNLLSRLPRIELTAEGAPWVTVTRRLNRLAGPGEPPRVDPLVVAVQRVYHDAARRYADSLQSPPAWVPRLLDDWCATLDAFARDDVAWLSARLDPWIKTSLFSALLRENRLRWRDLIDNRERQAELALVDHSYHEFCNPDSVFTQLDAAGALKHRVADDVPPGGEPEPFVPETATRAAARARFINEQQSQGQAALMVDWSIAYDLANHRIRTLEDPFASTFGPWQASPEQSERTRRLAALGAVLEAAGNWHGAAAVPSSPSSTPPSSTSQFREPFREQFERVLACYERGGYEEAHQTLEEVRASGELRASNGLREYLRYSTWVQTRRGMLDGSEYLRELSLIEPLDLGLITDYLMVYRFQGLVSRPELAAWTARGLALAARHPTAPCPPSLYEHQGYLHLVEGRPEEARRVLETLRSSGINWQGNMRVLARMLATLGEAYRILGEPALAHGVLDEAEAIQVSNNYEGDMADFTWLSRAKLQDDSRRAKQLLNQARSVQTWSANRMGLARTLCLHARIVPSPFPFVNARRKKQLLKLSRQVPALSQCRLLAKILARWHEWVGGSTPEDARDRFWGL